MPAAGESIDRYFSRLARHKRELPENFEQYSLLFATRVPEIEHHCERCQIVWAKVDISEREAQMGSGSVAGGKQKCQTIPARRWADNGR
jgi:hypothetical protein